MKTYMPAAAALALAFGILGGCTVGDDPALAGDAIDEAASRTTISGPNGVNERASNASVHEAIRVDLDRLRALEVFYVGGIVRDLPSEATGCYFDDIGGLPCPGWEDEVAASDAEQAPRLRWLGDTAEAAVGGVEPAKAVDGASVALALETLRALAIVEVGELMTVAPASNPSCYNLPCAEDVALAEEQERLAAAKLAAIADAAVSE
ncbi:MAG: hypothetical protein EXR75_09855 [Myxococcales bacterium]|nr:hypothetical protein [Myxococcales bacterium]